MVNILDVLETIKASSTPGKSAEASKTQTETKLTEAEAAKSQAETEAGPSKPAKEKSLETGEKETEKEAAKQILPEKLSLLLPKHLPKYLIILYDTLREKGYLKKKSEKLNIMPKN
jgi:DNA-directed RNA polymerase specialized sigma54-like protein